MIAIDVTMTPGTGCDFYSFDLPIEIVQESYQNVYDFLKSYIDQNIILNLTVDDNDEDALKFNTRYFATTIENAQAFEQAFSDMTAEFSMKKLWNHNKFDISIECHEIDFETATNTQELIGPYGEIWGVEFQN